MQDTRPASKTTLAPIHAQQETVSDPLSIQKKNQTSIFKELLMRTITQAGKSHLQSSGRSPSQGHRNSHKRSMSQVDTLDAVTMPQHSRKRSMEDVPVIVKTNAVPSMATLTSIANLEMLIGAPKINNRSSGNLQRSKKADVITAGSLKTAASMIKIASDMKPL